MTSPNEPKRLLQCKAFHKQVQKEWLAEAEGDVAVERTVARKNMRKGRVDVHVDADDMGSVVEIKCSDWDRMTLSNLKRNVRRQIRQVWKYIESQLEGLGDDEAKTVCPVIVFPKLPRDPARLQLIEEMFEEEGIPVVWQDESKEELKERRQDK